MNSVYLKNTLLLASMVLLSFLVFLLSFAIILRNHTISEKQAGLRANVESVTVMYSSFANFDPNRPEHYDMVDHLTSIVTLPHNRMMVANSRGIVVACSEGDDCPHIGQVFSDELRYVLSTYGEYADLAIMTGLVPETSYIYAQPVLSTYDGTHGGYVLAFSGADVVMEEWGAMLSLFLLVAVAVLIMAVVIAMVVARHQAAPLREMSAVAGKFAHGDFSARVKDRGRIDEIGELTAAFNAMADSIEQSEDMRREFVGNVSHELKTPMTSITGFADGILDGTIPPEKQGEYLQIIAAETRRLSRLVRRMLEVSRFQSMDIRELSTQAFDLTEVLRRGLLGVEQKITDRNLGVELELPDDSVWALGDEDSITQVAYNLLDNAAKFATPGTTVHVSLSQKSGRAFVTVRNEGAVISQEELSLLFNRFHKSDKSRSHDKEGVGLGLYIVKTIMNAHHEDIYVRSEGGVTEFMFTLTLAPRKK
ncbi:MAG: HAMP domain-containing histidine kinase [Oscillospiraceae bacterium]|nr:HAMP domain-containing histidine kinase [Oscillospiraceae bacterium]